LMMILLVSLNMSIFNFKEFAIDQENCPMKINTDGVLLGAMADVQNAKYVLDIGTGTGVIALMLAQRNKSAIIDGLDIDENAYKKSLLNFNNSIFHERLNVFHADFKSYFESNFTKKYDLIVSNPPFYLHALQSPKAHINRSKHTDSQFFLDLLFVAKNHLNIGGTMQLIVPVDVSLMLQNIAKDFDLCIKRCVKIRSYENTSIIRHIISLTNIETAEVITDDFCIYAQRSIHSLAYKAALKDFFTIF
jgi:tRNA1Val (adenine37-N6)-methyltransferase